jgi:ribosomal protein S18 acetylase RimI-like enzyme
MCLSQIIKMSKIHYKIRQATPLDFDSINILCVEAYQEFEMVVGPDNWQRMRDALSHASDLAASSELIVAENSHCLLGVVAYIPPGMSDGDVIPREWAAIRMLAVSPSCRGKGIGRKLTEECIERARRDSAGRIGLSTGEMMAVALPMYKRMGFQKDAELATRYGVSQARYVLTVREATV